MDAPRFDRFAKILAAPRTRRGVLVALLGGALGLMFINGSESPAAVAKKKTRRRRRHQHGGVLAQGPCGDGGPRHNACKRHGQCCTGYCDHKKRCRCRRPGDPCTEDRNCCPQRNGFTCQSGTCRPAATCAGQGDVCSASAQCCAGFACDASGHCQPTSTCALVGQSCSATVRCCNEQQSVTCQNGRCRASEVCVDGCDDGISCTDDVCDPATGVCIHAPRNERCGSAQICDPAVGCVAAAERCDGIDNDGDGAIDEGALCPGGPNATGVCVSGVCQIICNTGFANCDGNLTTGCEASLMTDTLNCGACGTTCGICPDGAPQQCNSGVCACGGPAGGPLD